jgi:hypothetical protein
MSFICVDFNGSLTVDPSDIYFVTEGEIPLRISGNEWICLPEEDKVNWVIEDLSKVMRLALAGESNIFCTLDPAA